PGSVALGDFNGDWLWDVAVSNSGAGTVQVLLGHGDGTLVAASGQPYPVPDSPHPIVTGDFDQDGITDLAVGSKGKVYVLLGQGADQVGNGTFATPVGYPLSSPNSGAVVPGLAAADFDNDGRADLAALAGVDGSLQYFYGDGTATSGNGRFLTGPVATVGGHLSTLAVNEFDLASGGSAPVVAQSDLGRIVSILGTCSGSTGRTLQ